MRCSKLIFILFAFICLGVNVCSGKYLVEYIETAPDKYIIPKIDKIAATIGESSISDTIEAILSSSGYYNAKVFITDSMITIDAGKLSFIGQINLEIIKPAGEILSKQIDQMAGVIASKEHIDSVKSEILFVYQEKGYFYASLNTVNVMYDDNLLEFNLRLLTGPLVNLDRIRFKGLAKTSPGFVEKLSGLKQGDALIFSHIERAAEKINNSGYLLVDTIPSVIPNQNYDGVELIFNLSELKSNQIEFAGGYLPGRGDRKGEFVGFLNFKSKNIFGGGRRIDLLIDRKDRLSSRIEFGYIQPFFIPELLEISGRFRQIDNGDFYYLFTIEAALAIQSGKHAKLTGEISWTKTEPQNLSQPPSRAWTGNISYLHSNLYDMLNPMKGNSFEGNISYIRHISWPDSVATGVVNNDSKFSAALNNYIPLANHFVFRLSLESQVYITSRKVIDFSEQFRLGGFASLRGYRQEQFSGMRVALGQAELRYRPSAFASLYMFSDLGYIYSRELISEYNLITIELFKPGFGVGIFAARSNTSVTLEAGWGEGDNLGQGKLHFGLQTKF
ncbi:MAG: POTRA domain-containing protein [Candidatus Zixiibacteriota bacterium]